MAGIYEDITKTVGNTPLVKLNHVTGGAGATVVAKLLKTDPWIVVLPAAVVLTALLALMEKAGL